MAVAKAKKKPEPKMRWITFQVTTRMPLPVGEQVFITGNINELGSWNAEGFPLSRVNDNLWAGTIEVPLGSAIEFKITRGSWSSEEVNEDGSAPANRIIEPGYDVVVQRKVLRWKDVAPEPQPKITGTYHIHDGIDSNFLRFARRVIVWLPPSYEKKPAQRYPVLYMQDGQQVFDPQTSTWNQDWQVDEWCTSLMGEKLMKEIIVVAVYSTDDRFIEYNPSLAGSAYTRFLLEELKPFIDREYRTKPDKANTAIAGSSMGGSLAFYAAWTHPDVFSAAACLSPVFQLKDDTFCFELVRKTSKAPSVKLFLYCGLGDPIEQTLMVGTREMSEVLSLKGFKPGSNLLFVEDLPAMHNEAAWAKHTREWLLFMFGE